MTTLCAHLYPKIIRYMRYRVGEQAAEDLTGDVFVRAIRNLGRQNGSFTAWLYKIAANVVNDNIRELRTHPMTALVENGAPPAEAAAKGDSPAQSVGRKLDLAAALEQLSEDQRQLVTLKFVQGLANEEVAAVMERTPGAVRVLQFRALSALRELLPEYEVRHED
jgi:RNA polymerase sigma-70 factor, ECF subfamily